jgi:hypothetical protein
MKKKTFLLHDTLKILVKKGFRDRPGDAVRTTLNEEGCRLCRQSLVRPVQIHAEQGYRNQEYSSAILPVSGILDRY